MRDSAGPSTAWPGRHTVAVSLIGFSLIFINQCLMWDQRCNTITEQTFKPSQSRGAQLRAGATFVNVTARPQV